MPTDSHQLDYAPPSRWHRGRRARRIALLCAVLVALGFCAWWGRRLVQRTEAHYWFDRCMSYVAMPGQIAYDQTRQGVRVVNIPRPWLKFFSYWSNSGAPRTSGTLFLHERSTPGGRRRLVAVDVISMGATRGLQVQSHVFEPPVGMAPARLISAVATTIALPVDAGHLQILAGEVDRENAAHFVLIYRIGGRRGLIDGWLGNDDAVVLEPRDPQPDFKSPSPSSSGPFQ